MDALRPILGRFPLVARPRPACRTLVERVVEVRELAQAAVGQVGVDPDAGLSLAAQAQNKAALIASDCGLPDLARSLCRRQFEVHLRVRPLSGQAARYALEPIVNLSRLLIRDGDGQGAYQLLGSVYQAVRARTDAVIDGRPVSFHEFTRSDEEHRALCQWLWSVVLADGSRALAGAGRWDEALAHVERHGGIGERLLDGRQIAILACVIRGDADSALATLEGSTPPEPWEQAVAACLTVVCLKAAARPTNPS